MISGTSNLSSELSCVNVVLRYPFVFELARLPRQIVVVRIEDGGLGDDAEVGEALNPNPIHGTSIAKLDARQYTMSVMLKRALRSPTLRCPADFPPVNRPSPEIHRSCTSSS